MKKRIKQSGFTTVELLVTLFVAAAFLMSGYQLYNMIIKNGGEARSRVKAGNYAYQLLQQYKLDTTNYIKNPCTAKTTNPITPSPTVDGLSNVSASVDISCPYLPTTPSISKITITVKYGNPQQLVTEATYASP